MERKTELDKMKIERDNIRRSVLAKIGREIKGESKRKIYYVLGNGKKIIIRISKEYEEESKFIFDIEVDEVEGFLGKEEGFFILVCGYSDENALILPAKMILDTFHRNFKKSERKCEITIVCRKMNWIIWLNKKSRIDATTYLNEYSLLNEDIKPLQNKIYSSDKELRGTSRSTDSFSSEKESRDLENELREIVLKILIKGYGNDWFEKGLPEKSQSIIKSRKVRDTDKFPYMRKDIESNPKRLMEYTDISTLEEIITDDKNWYLFKDIFLNRSELTKRMDDFGIMRNYLAHQRTMDTVVEKDGYAAITWISKCLRST